MPYLAGPPPMPGFLNALSGPLNHYGYWAILALVTLEDFGIPVPGETILIAAAIYAGHQQLNVVGVGLVGFAAAIIGDNIGFAIGHFGGRALALRWGRYVGLTEDRLTKAEHFFERHGGKIIVVARFIEGLRQANGIIAGITGMHWRRFLAFNALGAALWVGTWVSLGYLAGNHINTIYHYITQYSLYVLIAVVILIVAFIIRHVLRRRRRARPAVIEQHEAKEDSGTQEDSEVQQEPETQQATGTAAVAEVQDDAGPLDGGAAHDDAGTSDGAAPHDDAGTPDGAAPHDGAGTPDGAGIQSS
jgi:membrane protein DedA with SNARE-associated domain